MEEISEAQARRRGSTALFLGVAGVIASVVVIGGVLGIFAVRLGNGALGSIDESEGRIGGRGMARTGVILGWVGMALAVISLAVWIVVPANRGPRDEARLIQTEASMREILMACRLYADDYNDVLPPHLAAAITGGYGITPRMLRDARSAALPMTLPAEEKGAAADWHTIAAAVDAHCDFIYVGAGLKVKDADPRLLMLVAKLPAGKKRLAGTIGGAVEELGPVEFALRMKLTNAARKARGLPEIEVAP